MKKRSRRLAFSLRSLHLFDDKELREISERLDAREKAFDESIAQKEAYLNDLKANVEKSKKEVESLLYSIKRESN